MAAPGTPPGATARRPVVAVGDGARERQSDLLAVEEPLEIRVVAERGGRRERHSVAVTMRTPGHDEELAAGFLFTEGVVDGLPDLVALRRCESEPEVGNVVEAVLAPSVDFDPERFTRHVYTSSSCGVCGKASLEALRTLVPAPPVGDLRIEPRRLAELPDRLRAAQPVFGRTGGLHAAALFDAAGELALLREDVGRHNALDKLVGALLLAGRLPASEAAVLVSGRASFELVQKTARAGAPLLAAVGAPSSLAAETAEELGMTLVGFLRSDRFNVYAGERRIES